MKKIELLFIFLICGGVVLPLASGQNESQPYNFPIGPGTEEWAALESYEARLDAYNIPDSILEVMTTADLVETCLHYPEFRLIMTHNSLQQGYDYLRSIFNGFVELEQRPDAGAELISVYLENNPRDINMISGILNKGRFSFDMKFVEVLLSQKVIQRSLSLNDRLDLTAKAISNYETIKEMPAEYGTFGLVTSTLLLGRIMDVDKYFLFTKLKSDNNLISTFIEHSQPADVSQFDAIVSIAREYLKYLKNE